ncbi:hypothetical protein HDU98_011398 [Podochytrium sp. JEL0797]|nr:hypothetical protein HDU98_011398 [Podochytrium sp. JEL0797]
MSKLLHATKRATPSARFAIGLTIILLFLWTSSSVPSWRHASPSPQQPIPPNNTWSTQVNALLSPPVSPRPKLLLGIFSYYSDNEKVRARRKLLRTLYRQIQNSTTFEFDVRFVMGIPKPSPEDPQNELHAMQSILVEQTEHGDLLIINTPEEMNAGKSFHFFQQVIRMANLNGARLPRYEFIAKADDDTFINLSNLSNALALHGDGLAKRMFLGRACSDAFLCGCLYIMSHALADGFARLPVKNVGGPEDQMMSGKVKLLAGEEWWGVEKVGGLRFIDHWDSGKTWAEPFVEDVVAVHQCKEVQRMQNLTDMLLSFEQNK